VPTSCFFFFSLSIFLNFLLPGSVKLKHNAENSRHLQASESTWTCHNTRRHRTSNCCLPAQISLHHSVSATLPTIMQHRKPQKESCYKHLGRPGLTKHKQTQNLCLPLACAAQLIHFQPSKSANPPGEYNTLFGREPHILAQLGNQLHPLWTNWWPNTWREYFPPAW
jgi:hypothetical protein